MEMIDCFTSNVVTRAKYLQNIDNGMDYDSAMENANSFAASVLADRSKGAVPLIFDVKNPLTKAITMFQVEQNNQLRYLVKDLPRNLQEKGIMSIIFAIAKYAIASWLYNILYEKLIGRKPAFDPIDMGYEMYKDFTTEKPIKAILNTITNSQNVH